MKIIICFLLFLNFGFAQDLPHCGFDFTTYLVVNPVFNGKVIENLKITIVDINGIELLNTNNNYSFVNKDETLNFKQNQQITLENNEKRWGFKYCQNQYYIQLSKTFEPEENGFQIKIEDPKKFYATIILPIQRINLYVLCTSEVKKFGPKLTNQMIDVALELNKM